MRFGIYYFIYCHVGNYQQRNWFVTVIYTINCNFLFIENSTWHWRIDACVVVTILYTLTDAVVSGDAHPYIQS